MEMIKYADISQSPFVTAVNSCSSLASQEIVNQLIRGKVLQDKTFFLFLQTNEKTKTNNVLIHLTLFFTFPTLYAALSRKPICSY